MLALVALIVAAPIPRDAPKVNFFPLTQGHTWTYRTNAGGLESGFTISVAEAETKDGRTISKLKYNFDGAEQSETMAADAAGVYRPGEDGFAKPVLVLKYPLTVGSTWESKMPLGGASPEAKATVKRTVEVKVPAGKFEAVEVEFVSAGEKGNTLTAWYAINVGVIKQTTVYDGRSTTIELAEFKPGK